MEVREPQIPLALLVTVYLNTYPYVSRRLEATVCRSKVEHSSQAILAQALPGGVSASIQKSSSES